jgi:hypothetical protein
VPQRKSGRSCSDHAARRAVVQRLQAATMY